MTRIGFIGVGTMGLPMTTNLVKKGFAVTAFDMLHEALDSLPHPGAAGQADAALSSLDAAEHAYRQAIACLETEPDPRREMRLRELYRRAEHLALAVQRLGRRTWYAVCKIS